MPSGAFKTLRSFFHHRRELRRFRKLGADQRQIVFYAETAAFRAYLGPFIDRLVKDHGKEVCYVTSDDSDPILRDPPKGVRPFAIGDGINRTAFFASLDAGLMVMTLLDLQTFDIKRSMAAPVHYVFVPHNMLSTHMVFRKGAYDHFDTVFCVGPHHVAEIKEAEELYGLPAKTLVENGYVRLDAMLEEAAVHPGPARGEGLNIVIAPSWGPDCLLERGAGELVENLLAAGHRVCVRPHWETRRRAGPMLDGLEAAFGSHPGFSLVQGTSSNDLFYNAHLLISDWSGAVFSFAFGVERPVLFIDTPKKVNNPEYKKFRNRPIEITLRDELGAVLSPDNFKDAASVVQRLCENPDAHAEKIRALRAKWVFNIGHSADKGAQILADLAYRGHAPHPGGTP